jgi:hypothetical protein
MELIKTEADKLMFHLSKREKRLLLEIFKLYPLLPQSHHPYNQGEADAEESNLLEEVLAEQKKRNRDQLDAVLKESGRFQTKGGGVQFFLRKEELEWLLQILNEIRVGSWMRLGSPDPREEKELEVHGKNAVYLVAMEMCAYFQMVLLRSLEF